MSDLGLGLRHLMGRTGVLSDDDPQACPALVVSPFASQLSESVPKYPKALKKSGLLGDNHGVGNISVFEVHEQLGKIAEDVEERADVELPAFDDIEHRPFGGGERHG